MRVFPQLSTGASALYPLVRQFHSRTLVNVADGAERIVYADIDSPRRNWELHASGLTDDESTQIDNLFALTEGALRSFTLLDPAGNLLERSEEFQSANWTQDPLLQITAGQADPFGSTRASLFANPTVNSLGISQTLLAPGSFEYTLSVWARSDDSSAVVLTASSGASSLSEAYPLSSNWHRISRSVSLGEDADSITFGFSLQPGGTGLLFGAQVEAQPGSSPYKRTLAKGGVYQNVRFASDQLTFRAQGADVFDTVIHLTTAGI